MRKKHEYSKEEVQNYIKAGYSFQRKRVDKYTYIVRRKGKESKSMGSFTPELWNRIIELEEKRVHTRLPSRPSDDVESKYARRRRRYDAGVNFMLALDIARGLEMVRNCTHKKDDYCEYWRWDEEGLFTSYLRDMYPPGVDYIKKRSDAGVDHWVIRAGSFYCRHCPAFQRK